MLRHLLHVRVLQRLLHGLVRIGVRARVRVIRARVRVRGGVGVRGRGRVGARVRGRVRGRARGSSGRRDP